MKKEKENWEGKTTKSLPPKFRGVEKGIIVKVLEGEGTEEDVFRIVYYIYDEKLEPVGKIDLSVPHQKL